MLRTPCQPGLTEQQQKSGRTRRTAGNVLQTF